MTDGSLPQPKPELQAFHQRVLRIVESQEQVATTKIVANLEEQDLLETMLEGSKPVAREAGLHYLLSTPFRYPPLRYGSRFGSRWEPSLFYASLETATCLAESAYYRFLFWHDMVVAPPRPLQTQHTLFAVPIQSAACVDLRQPPFADRQCDLRSVTRYAYTQAVGAQLRELGADMLLFASARAEGLNAGLFTPAPFAGRPCDQSQWHSEVDAQRVAFRGPEGVFRFPLEQFADHTGELARIQG